MQVRCRCSYYALNRICLHYFDSFFDFLHLLLNNTIHYEFIYIIPPSMTAQAPSPSRTAASPKAAQQALYRSAAAAKLAHMPVATLRVWERRYQLCLPTLSAGGQRLYSDADVARLALIKRLCDQGHAIGQLAALDLPQLQTIAASSFDSGPGSPAAGANSGATAGARAGFQAAANATPWRVAVIGPALAQRLTHSALLRQLHRPIELLGAFEHAKQAAQALGNTPPDTLPDALLIHAPNLHPQWLTQFAADAGPLATVPKAVVYGFVASKESQALEAAGFALQRDSASDASLGQWLAGLSQQQRGQLAAQSIRPRLWSDAQLSQFAAMPTTVACECPQHVAQLLQQLAHFEAYTQDCTHRSPSDAALHNYLSAVAGSARASFETALKRVALHEGLQLPA